MESIDFILAIDLDLDFEFYNLNFSFICTFNFHPKWDDFIPLI